MKRSIGWDGFHNARDLGGLPTGDGRVTRFGAYIRSANVRFVTDTGWREAYDAGLRTVVDLRNDHERLPDHDPGPPPGIDHRQTPLDDFDDAEFWDHVIGEQLHGSPLYYPLFLERKADRCAAIVTTLARAAPGAVLFHCVAGRDRTGLVTLLLLALAGVEPETIADDYELSATSLAGLFAAMGEPDQAPQVASSLAKRGTTARAAILATLNGFDAESHLVAAGVTPTDLEVIRTRLVRR